MGPSLVAFAWLLVAVWVGWIAWRDGRRQGQWEGWRDAGGRRSMQHDDLWERHKRLLDDFAHAIAVLESCNETLHLPELDDLVEKGRQVIVDEKLGDTNR